MGEEVGSIHYTLDLDDKKFNKGMDQARSSISGLSLDLEAAERGSKAFAAGLLSIGAAGIAAGGFGVKIAGDLEAARQGFVALLGSAEEADKTMARIKKEAATTPFELKGLVEGTQALTAITKNGDQAVDILLDVGKAIATSGKGQAELDRVVLNLQQIASTGKVTAMDIRQFQSAIPMFNDIVEASGMTIQGLQDSETAAEDLFEAFRKAGETGGLTAQGFEAQAGTFKQLWSNLVDSVTIGASDLVKELGVFDAVKKALADIIGVLGNITSPEGIETIKGFFSFLSQNAPIVAGIIIGALVPAFYAWATGVWALMAPLIPFMAIGAALGILVKEIVDAMGGWSEVQNKLAPIVELLGQVFNEILLPPLTALWNQIKNDLLPALKELWDVISPVLIPVLIGLAGILGGTIVAALWLLINGIRLVIAVITEWVGIVKKGVEVIVSIFQWLYDVLIGNSIIPDLINGIVGWFSKLPNLISSALSSVYNAIISPFKNAFEWIKNKVGEVVSSLERLNPFHRESPSLVDKITKGVSEIQSQFDRLSVNITPVADIEPIYAGVNSGMAGTQNVTINIDRINDQQDIDAIGRELGFRTGLRPGVISN